MNSQRQLKNELPFLFIEIKNRTLAFEKNVADFCVKFFELALKEIQIEKLYFTITEVAAQFNIAASVLRYWESEFIIIQPKKSRKGDRLYTKEDIENVKLIYHLLREKGFTIEGAKKHLKENKNANQQIEMIESLQKIRQQLLELKEKI